MATAALPTGPRGSFFIGNLPELSRDWLGTFTRYAREYGDFVPLHFGLRRGCLLNRADLIEQVLVAKNRIFIKSPLLRNSRRLLGNGLLLSEGDFWRRQRRLVQPAFHKQRLAAYGEVMAASSERMVAAWHDEQHLDAHEAMMQLTLEIVTRCLFSAEVGSAAAEVSAAMAVAQDRFNTRMGGLLAFFPDTFPTPGNLPFLRAARRLDRVVQRIIEERRASGEDTGDLLSMLLHARDEDGSAMTDRQVRDEVMTLFLAGHETTALALSWGWYLLAQHPEVEERLVGELGQVLGGRTPTVADLPDLPYTAAVVSETLRLYPPAWAVSRQATADCEVGGYAIPRGSVVLMSQWVVHRDPRSFDQPERFLPERWLDGLARRLPRFAYFPFGGGPRQCIGNGFATMEAALVLATVAQRYHLALATDRPVVPWPSITLRPKAGIPVRLERR